jgi:hypothetical protein
LVISLFENIKFGMVSNAVFCLRVMFACLSLGFLPQIVGMQLKEQQQLENACCSSTCLQTSCKRSLKLI